MRKLTEGKPIKVILVFMIPILIGQIFQLFYNLVDTRIVGEILGEKSLAAVASTTSLSDLLTQFIIGVTNGFSIITAAFFGAKDKKNLKKSIGATLVLGIAFSIVLSVVCIMLIEPMLRFLNVEDELIFDAKSYIVIILAGIVVAALYNVCAASLRAIGDSLTPLIFLIISAVLNIVLDYSFIKYLNLDVAGAAYATVLSQMVSVVLCFVYIKKKYPDMIPSKEDMKLDKVIVSKLIPAGLSMGFMQTFVNIGTLCIQTQINTFGPDIIVSHTASRKMFSLLSMPFFVLAMTFASFSAQNMGAGKYERIKEGLRDTFIFCAFWTVVCILVSSFFSEPIIHQITGIDNEIITMTSKRYVTFHTYFFFILAVICIFRNAMQGFGDSKTPIFSSSLELIVKILIAYFLVPVMGYNGVILCEPVAWIIMVIPLIVNMFRSPVFSKKVNSSTLDSM